MKVMATMVALLACAMLAPAAARAQQDELASPKLRIEWAEFKKLYDTKGTVVVDVRDAVSFQNGHIPGARSIPLGDVEKMGDALKTLKKPIVLYCA